jgi:hypothetical protein
MERPEWKQQGNSVGKAGKASLASLAHASGCHTWTDVFTRPALE